MLWGSRPIPYYPEFNAEIQIMDEVQSLGLISFTGYLRKIITAIAGLHDYRANNKNEHKPSLHSKSQHAAGSDR